MTNEVISVKTRLGRSLLLSLALSMLLAPGARAADPAAAGQPLAGLVPRVPWTSSRVVGSPEPPAPYQAEQVFPKLRFTNPTVLTSAPGLDRLFVAELDGRIYSFPNRQECERPDLFFDMKAAIPELTQVYGMTFHPQFEENRFVYICYVLKPDLPEGSCVSRFTVSREDPPQVDPDSEQLIITWLSGGHNGGCLKFGPDGYLYITTGDGVGPNPPDTLQTGQDLSDLLSSILRIDVDNPPPGQAYGIPPDNPFVNLPDARPENWAYGFRNPWKMSFDARSGDLWVGDVGWELWELVYRVERGGNYGWSITEGRQPINPQGPRGPTPILPPLMEHPHSEAASITGGFVYYGQRLPELQGAYIYGDYETGKMWGLRSTGDVVDWHQELTDTPLRIICFGTDQQGELYFMDYSAGTLHWLVESRVESQTADFPRTLSASGLFTDTARHEVAPGVVSYSILAEPWADHAQAERFLALSQRSAIRWAADGWQFPPGAVLMKTLSLQTASDPAQRRLLETQLLHYDGQAWQPYTYAWNDEQADASLVEAAGRDRVVEVRDPAAPGGARLQRWRYASRAECLRCHNIWADSALAMNILQLNKPHRYAGVTENQLHAWSQAGLVEQLPELDDQLHLVDPHDESADLGARARSYLHSNCAHCHRHHAGSAVLSQLAYDVPLERSHLLGVLPSQGSFGIRAAQVIAPGEPSGSVLFYRMAKMGAGRMPYLGSELVDPRGVELIQHWIEQLSPTEVAAADPPPPGSQAVSQQPVKEEQYLARLRDPAVSSEAEREAVAALLATTNGALQLLCVLHERSLDPERQDRVVAQAADAEQPHMADLFVRFLPPSEQSQPAVRIDPTEVLTRNGDVQRGRWLFAEAETVQCRTCHRAENIGRAVGPDLEQVAGKYSRSQLLDSIAYPSRTIEPQYRNYLIETADGRVYTGLLLERTADRVVVKNAQGEEVFLNASDVELVVPQPTSLMPDLLLRDLQPQDIADLLAFLQSLQKPR